MAIVSLPPPLAKHVDGQMRLTLTAQTLTACIDEIKTRYPQLYQLIFTSKTTLHGFVNLYLNERCVSTELASNTAVAANDRLDIVASVSGG